MQFYFTGTNANALPGILKYGMNSVDKALENNIPIVTGEKWTRINGHRSFISFTDNLRIALRYASEHPSIDGPNNLCKNHLSFGILLGISLDDINKLKTCRVYSDTPEIGIIDHIPLEYIKFIAVPKEQVDFVKKLVGTKPIAVTEIDLKDKFYISRMYIDMLNYLQNLKGIPESKNADFFDKLEEDDDEPDLFFDELEEDEDEFDLFSDGLEEDVDEFDLFSDELEEDVDEFDLFSDELEEDVDKFDSLSDTLFGPLPDELFDMLFDGNITDEDLREAENIENTQKSNNQDKSRR